MSHREFLADADSDPRRPFAETLIAALKGSKLPIIVYSSYEQTRLAELAAHFPDLAKPLRSIVRRLSGSAADRAWCRLSSEVRFQQLDQDGCAGSLS